MNHHNETVTVVIVSDDHFAPMLAALLKSIDVNHLCEQKVDIHIVSDRISRANINKLQRIPLNNTISLHWTTLQKITPPELRLPKDNTSFPVNAYARLYIPHFLPKNVSRAIYLDVDTIVLKDISELWNMDLAGYPIGAVADRSAIVSSPWGGIKNYKELGLDADTPYFNSGLMLIDIEKWRAMDATNAVIQCSIQNKKHITFADQYGLNVVFANNWRHLPKEWNTYAQSPLEDPALIHFTGMKPIFKGYAFSEPYKQLFFHYLSQTPWNGFKPKSNRKRMLKKIWNYVTKRW